VIVTDQYGNIIVGAPVTWTDSIAGGGSVSVQAGLTSALGMASTTWTLGRRAGGQYLRARLTGRTGPYDTVSVTASATVAYSDVFAGNFMACGVAAASNNVYCWGAGTDGQLGKGVNTSISAPTTPVSIGGDSIAGPFLAVRQLTGGRNSYCALSVARQIYCWGRTPGQQAVTNNSATLVNIVDPRQQILPMMLAAGLEHLCVLDLSGLGFCTGTNFAGQLGDGTNISPAVGTYPFIAPAPPANLSWSTIAAGKQHTCAFRQFVSAATANNLVPYCWGLNNAGQVGNGTIANVNMPTQVTLPPGFPTAYDTTSLAVGGSHTCVLDNAGAAYCWGSNGFGQLGTGGPPGSTNRDTVMRAVSMPSGVAFRSIYAGEYHTCALSTTGVAYCWGRNDYGQLGDETTTNATKPVLVHGNYIFRSLSVGELFTCGVAGAGQGVAPPPIIPGAPSQSPGTVYCWGDNLFGQIGQNTTGNNQPIRVPTRVWYQP
jgi:alpha-tubulin suppressor-like RCC1 family protein